MGILIGKANQTLSEYEVINQSVENDNFKTKSRSINKSLQSYSWKEKSEIKYDLDFLEESDYRDILYLLANKNSLHEGLITLPIPYSDNSTKCIFDYNAVSSPSSTHKIKHYAGVKTVDTLNPTSDGTELTTGDYNQIEDYNSSDYTLNNTGNGCWLMFDFLISDFLTTASLCVSL